jgi:hypothetical protein
MVLKPNFPRQAVTLEEDCLSHVSPKVEEIEEMFLLPFAEIEGFLSKRKYT